MSDSSCCGKGESMSKLEDDLLVLVRRLILALRIADCGSETATWAADWLAKEGLTNPPPCFTDED